VPRTRPRSGSHVERRQHRRRLAGRHRRRPAQHERLGQVPARVARLRHGHVRQEVRAQAQLGRRDPPARRTGGRRPAPEEQNVTVTQ
jgi:hypothetical protein